MTDIDTITFEVKSKAELGSYTLLTLKTEGTYPQNPGQYCIVHYSVDGQDFTRPYSIASEPREDGVIELCVLHSGDQQTATAIQTLKMGSKLEISPAGGRFQVPDHSTPAVFIAGGSGITPLRSMIKWRLAKSDQMTTLLYGCKTTDEIPYFEDFRALTESHDNFRVQFYADENQNDEIMKGHALAEISKFLDTESHYFLCGPPKMIEAAKTTFHGEGIQESQVHTDRY